MAPGPRGPRSRLETAPPRGLARGLNSEAPRAKRRPRTGARIPVSRTAHRCGKAPWAAPRAALGPAPHSRGHCLRPAAAGGLKNRAASLPGSRPHSLPPVGLGRWVRTAPHLPPLAAPGHGGGPGLAASGGGGASGPSDHLWKQRSGGCLLVQLQPTSGSYFGAPAAPPPPPEQPPAQPGRGATRGNSPVAWQRSERGWAAPPGLGGPSPRVPPQQVGRLLRGGRPRRWLAPLPALSASRTLELPLR